MITLFFSSPSFSQTFCTQPDNDRFAGVKDGYRYELWNQNGAGTACMTIDSGALFSGSWDDIENYLARRGLEYDETQLHHEIGTFYSTYDCDYRPTTESGNSYLAIYGWTMEPMIEYYIVEDWRNWIPSMAPGATHTGTIEVNGSIYDIVKNTRVNQPSIIGNATFEQYFSIRRDTRTSGTINISDHFSKWESLGMELGKMYEVSFVVEGYMSDGSFDFRELDVFLGDPASAIVPSGSIQALISPNGEHGTISIDLGKTDPKTLVRIYDLKGKLIFSEAKNDRSLLRVPKLKSGLYFLNLYGPDLNYTARFSISG